jgi:tol-pal system protein YbgF
MQDGKVVGATNNPQAPALPPTPPDYGLTPQEQYDRAFDLLRQTDYEDASDAFKTFVDKNPHDKLVEDAKYWYGETLYVQDKFDAAAIAFADSYQQNPNGSKAPESLLKLAKSLDKIGKTADACTTLESLKSKYPKAPIKVRQDADQERTTLKCSAQTQSSKSQ